MERILTCFGPDPNSGHGTCLVTRADNLIVIIGTFGMARDSISGRYTEDKNVCCCSCTCAVCRAVLMRLIANRM